VHVRRLAAFVVVLGLGGPALAVASSSHPTFPTCAAFSRGKVSRLVAAGRLYLDSTMVDGTSCIYYGVNAAQAAKLASTGVSYSKITYYPSLMIAVTPATKSLFDLQLNLIKRTANQQELEFGSVAKRLRFTRDEYFYAGQISGGNEVKCDPQIQYDNWVGPPECGGEPTLKKVGVIAFIPTTGSHGRLLTITATEQAPGTLSLSHILELARQTVNGQLY
jgi:hypothetical protein